METLVLRQVAHDVTEPGFPTRSKAPDERTAERLLHAAWAALGLTLSEARSGGKRSPPTAVAWLLRRSTVVSADWVIGKLSLRHRSNASRAMGVIQGAQGIAAAQIRREVQCQQRHLFAAMHGPHLNEFNDFVHCIRKRPD
jgi:hypothetical protein